MQKELDECPAFSLHSYVSLHKTERGKSPGSSISADALQLLKTVLPQNQESLEDVGCENRELKLLHSYGFQ